jgi:hypothetical protein
MDSLDLIEAVMLIEEIFRTAMPEADAETFGSPREMVDWLERHLSNRRPNKQAAAFLKKLANITITLNWPKAWKELGDANRLRPLSPKSFGTRITGQFM